MTRYFCVATLEAACLLTCICVGAADDDKDTKKDKGKGQFGQLGQLFGDPEAMFKKMDADGDKKVKKEEFKKYFEDLTQGFLKDQPQIMDQMFERLDGDKDGSVTLEEFKKMSNLGGRLGDKGKGKVDLEKLKKLIEKKKGKE